jgi:hypothetical protein
VIVQSQSAKKAVLTALADEEMMKILDSVMYHSKSIVDISRALIPSYKCFLPRIFNEVFVVVYDGIDVTVIKERL